MIAKLTDKDVVKIEKVLNASGRKEAVVRVENGQVVVLSVERRKV